MKALIQRVLSASVIINKKVYSEISYGLLVFLGIEVNDHKDDANYLVNKIVNLRIFNDSSENMNLSLGQIDGQILLVSQFTLCASTEKGNRPSFTNAAKPEQAIVLYNYFIDLLKAKVQKPIQTGVFGSDMKINLINDGPVTFLITSY